MMAGADSYRRLYDEFSKRDNFAGVFGRAVDDAAAEVDLSDVRSCLAFGTGSGQHELQFARRLLPNMASFVAVEPDHESVNALRTSFEASAVCV